MWDPGGLPPLRRRAVAPVLRPRRPGRRRAPAPGRRPRLRPRQPHRRRSPSAGRTRRSRGLDSSPEMIDKARALGAPVDFARRPTCATGARRPDVDVVVTNAVLQWVPGHEALLLRWVARAAAPARGSPCRCPATSTRRRTGRCARSPAEPPVAGPAVGDVVRAAPVPDAAGYADTADRRRAARSTPGRLRTCTCCPASGADHPVLRLDGGHRAAAGPGGARRRRGRLAGLPGRRSARGSPTAYPVRHGRGVLPVPPGLRGGASAEEPAVEPR